MANTYTYILFGAAITLILFISIAFLTPRKQMEFEGIDSEKVPIVNEIGHAMAEDGIIEFRQEKESGDIPENRGEEVVEVEKPSVVLLVEPPPNEEKITKEDKSTVQLQSMKDITSGGIKVLALLIATLVITAVIYIGIEANGRNNPKEKEAEVIVPIHRPQEKTNRDYTLLAPVDNLTTEDEDTPSIRDI